uniref:Uncharacterized mitochondrial protein AtMg00810-like n=1 Tax=Tanacetum cinerariifolium TaxID=118510 RepID=A0A6L2KE76_TANCI|nr:uncharacterized mitochondrial protein AtMg00810-like [Tanacetum cinerariifolium]
MAEDDNILNDGNLPETSNTSPPDYPIWKVIQNGNGPVSVITATNGIIKVLPPKTAKEVMARERERKARTTLLMALPEDHLAKFHKMADAKEMWEAIKLRFSGNDESNKMQKYLLKQQFEGFSFSTSECLHKGYDSFDDLYNNLRVCECAVEGTTASSSNTYNVAFVSAENTSNTNDVSTAYSVSSPSVLKSQKEGSSSYTDEVIHSFFVNQSSAPQLDYDDLEQINNNDDDMEEMDIKWQANDLEDTPVNDRFADGMHAVPPSMTRNYMPSGPDVEIDYSKFTYDPKQTLADESDSKPSEYASCESNSNVDTSTFMPELVENASKDDPHRAIEDKGIVDSGAVNTGCYVLNRVLVTKPQNKTYELLTVENQANKSTGPKETNNSAEQVFLEDLEKLKRQEKEANDAAESLRKEATHDIQNTSTSSTKLINTASILLSTAGPSRAFNDGEFSYPDPSKYALPDDPSMTYLEDIYATPSERIFTDSSYNDEAVVTDFNLETTMSVSPTPTTRIHTIHPKIQILRDPKSAIQTRRKVNKNFKAHALVKQNKDGIFISQDKYVAEILKKFDFLSVKTASTPIETQNPLVKDEEVAHVDVTPKTSHLHAVKRIFRYLKGQPKLSLWYPKVSSFDLKAYSDSDYASANLDRKSTTGATSVKGRLIEFTMSNTHQELASPEANGFRKDLASPKQTALGKDISNLLMAGSSKTTPWNEFSSTMASTIIFLATNQKFNFSRYILLSLVKNIEAGVAFFMFPRFVQLLIDHRLGDMSHHKDIYDNSSLTKKVFANIKRVGTGFFGVVTPLFNNMLVLAAKDVGLIKDDVQLPSPSNDPLPGGKDSLKLKELMDLCTHLSNKVLELESKVIDIKSTYKERIEKLEGRVDMLEEENRVLKELHSVYSKVDIAAPVVENEKSFKHGRIIADINEDGEINLEEAQAKPYRMDLEHPKKVLSMKDVDDEEPVEVEEVLEVSVLRKRRGVVIQDPEETTSTVGMHSEPDVEANVWRDQKGRYGLAKRYPLTHFTLEQILNNVRLVVEEESEMSFELLRLVRRQLNEGYVPE